ncbi:hypothetical protein SeMB42_g07702 [Synchytrium endobioticum]|uniref:Uncharacterized protein n=1 Tax=Synchytrium endobioticum TaxID=286115 RepID=A0A507CYM3_9FUNG|nr:hypothetical protein SeMB42_g07702 [Synchytrium endobioticum]TPX44254.1 hypothetical protein SeLEV6574_g04603 [Synchytrium endobioticum]
MQTSSIPTDELEMRLRHLEAIVSSPSRIPSSSSSSSSLLESLDNIVTRFRELQDGDPAIEEFIRKYAALRNWLRDDSNDLERAFLDTAAVKEIILASADDIEQAGTRLSELESLKDEVDSPLLKDLSKFIPQFSPLEARYMEQRRIATNQKERYLQQLDSYNAFIDSTSRLFIHYHQVLSMTEDLVTAAEKRAARKIE